MKKELLRVIKNLHEINHWFLSKQDSKDFESKDLLKCVGYICNMQDIIYIKLNAIYPKTKIISNEFGYILELLERQMEEMNFLPQSVINDIYREFHFIRRAGY